MAPDAESGGVWRENEAAVDAFLAVQTQWRRIGMADGTTRVQGLDYTACEAGFRMAGIEMTPDLWDAVQVIEQGAKAQLNGA